MYSTTVAYVLWALGGFGALGLHRFYLRKIPTGALWLFTGGLGMVGAIYDFFTLGKQVREANAQISYKAREALAYDGQNFNGDNRNFAPTIVNKPESIEKVILRTAKKNSGIVTPGEIAIESEYSIEEAKKVLEKFVSQGQCEMKIRQSGVIVYFFAEFSKENTDIDSLI